MAGVNKTVPSVASVCCFSHLTESVSSETTSEINKKIIYGFTFNQL